VQQGRSDEWRRAVLAPEPVDQLVHERLDDERAGSREDPNEDVLARPR
jgi:hypothetical protein